MASTVLDIVELVALRLPVGTRNHLIPAVNSAIRKIGRRLFTRGSDMISSSLSVKFEPGAASASLPSDFWGFRQKPYIFNKTYPLYPLPDKDLGLTMMSAGLAKYFKVKNQTLYLYPYPTSSWTLTASDLSFTLATSTIASVAEEFSTTYLTEGVLFTVEDSTSNDATLTMSSTAATAAAIVVDDTLVGELAGEEITLTAGVVVNGDYFAAPTKVTDLLDTVPWNELFDEVIAECVVHLHRTSPDGHDPTQLGVIDKMINDYVDEIVPHRDKDAAAVPRDVIDWSSF